MSIGEIIPMAESYCIKTSGFYVIWPVEARKVIGEPATHMGKGLHEGGDHSISYITKARKRGSVHFMRFVAWINCTRWHLKILPAANGKVPQPMKQHD